MKSPFTKLVAPWLLAGAAIGAAYAIGWAQAGKEDEAAALEYATSTPASSPEIASSTANENKTNEKPRLPLSEARERLQKILAGELGAGESEQASAIADLLEELDPKDALVLAQTLPDKDSREDELLETLRRWQKLGHAKDALDYAASLPDKTLRQMLIFNLIAAWNDKMPTWQLVDKYLGQLRDSKYYPLAIGDIAADIAGKNLGQALEWLESMTAPGSDLYNATVADIIHGLTNPIFNEQSAHEFGLPSGVYLDAGSAAKLTAAVDLLGKMNETTTRSIAIEQIANLWSMLDAASAATWAASLPDTDATARTIALKLIMSDWEIGDPKKAAEFVANSPDPELFSQKIPELAGVVSQYDPQAALNFVQSLPDGTAKNLALSVTLAKEGAADFTDAWSTASALPTGVERDAAMDSVLAVEAKSDPAQAANLLPQMSAGPALEDATRTLAKTWADLDPSAAVAWMQALPSGGERDTATVELISTQVNADPATALQWAVGISAPSARVSQLQRVVSVWAKTDASAALKAIQNLDVTDTQRAALTQAVFQSQPKSK